MAEWGAGGYRKEVSYLLRWGLRGRPARTSRKESDTKWCVLAHLNRNIMKKNKPKIRINYRSEDYMLCMHMVNDVIGYL